jgi:transposase
MAHSRDSARTYGKSDPIDALAVARAALREPGLPTAHLDDTARELRLLVDHREDLVGERTRHINRLRWHLHEIEPSWDPDPRVLTTFKHLDSAAGRLAGVNSVISRIAVELVERVRQLTIDINALRAELEDRPGTMAPRRRRCGPATTTGTDSARPATANPTLRSIGPLSPRPDPTPKRSPSSPAAPTKARPAKKPSDHSKRRLSDVIYRAMLADAALAIHEPDERAA